jgi:hypothetical protein
MRDTSDLIIHGRRFVGFEQARRVNRALMAVAAVVLLCGATLLVLRHSSPEARMMMSAEGMLYELGE